MDDRPREGDILDVVCVGGHHFTIRYGYYDEAERAISEPIPIYPCFIEEPVFTPEGRPLVTRMQDACEHYTTTGEGDGWCADCIYCLGNHQQIGVCQCEHRRKQNLHAPYSMHPVQADAPAIP